jgi:hydrogenase-4 component E
MIFLYLYNTYSADELGSWAIIAFFTKVIFVPVILLRLIKKLKVEHEDEPVLGFYVSPIVAIAFSLAIAMALYPIYLKFSLIKEHIPLIASITIFMIGIFGFVLRNSAIKQILAYCTFENGIHLSLALMAYNSPEIVELGILTDALFAVIITSIFATRFFKYFGSLDVSKATELKG